MTRKIEKFEVEPVRGIVGENCFTNMFVTLLNSYLQSYRKKYRLKKKFLAKNQKGDFRFSQLAGPVAFVTRNDTYYQIRTTFLPICAKN